MFERCDECAEIGLNDSVAAAEDEHFQLFGVVGVLGVEFIVEVDGKGTQIGSVLEKSTIAAHSHARTFRHHEYLQVVIALNHLQQSIFLKLERFQAETLQSVAFGQRLHQLGVIDVLVLALRDGHFPQSFPVVSEVIDPVGVVCGVLQLQCG